MIRIRSLPVLGTLALVAACGGDGGGDGGPDTRCFGIAQVPAWAIHITSSFSDTGSFNGSTMLLHVTMDVADTTGAVVTQAHGVSWFGASTTGTITRRDTLINGATHDTTVGVSHRPSGIGSAGGLATLYVSTNLESCTASIGGVVQAPESTFVNGVFDHVDTLNVGYAFAPGFTIDAGSPGAGWALAPLAVRSITQNGPFHTAPEYRAGGFASSYTAGNNVALLDSATVGWTATPVATPASMVAVPMVTLQNGRVIPLARP
ncbi:MAG TPA: hypothetical protein VG712_01270 [Gemmatimonadales bacterium]|nr:hypothetical protein [Gemmatimonadales bacterium]